MAQTAGQKYVKVMTESISLRITLVFPVVQ